MQRLRELIEVLNRTVYNPVGLNILWPRQVAFMFVRPTFHPPEATLTVSLVGDRVLRELLPLTISE